MTRGEWAKFDGRVVVVEDDVCGGMIGRYRHSDGVLDPHSVRGDSTQAGAVPCSVIYGPWSASLWRPEVGETVRVVGPDLPIVVTSCTGKSVAGEFVPGEFWSAGLEHVEPAWFPDRTASAPEPAKPSPPPIEAPDGWELVDSHWAWRDGQPEGYRTIRKGDSVREERIDLRDGEWRMVTSKPAERVIGPDTSARGRSVFADSLELLRKAAVGVGLPAESVTWDWERPQPFGFPVVDPVKGDGIVGSYPPGFKVVPVEASSGEEQEVMVDLDSPIGVRWDIKHDVGAKALKWKRGDKNEHWYDDDSGLQSDEAGPREDRAEPEGDPVYVDHLRCMGFDVSDLGVLRDGQWVQFMAADPPMRDGEMLWHRGAVPERADDQVKVAMVRGESSGKSEPLRGSLGGVMVFDHALSDEEVGELAKGLEASDPPPFPRPLVQSPEQVEQRTQAEAGFRSALRRWRVVHGLVPEERVSWWVRLWRWARGR